MILKSYCILRRLLMPNIQCGKCKMYIDDICRNTDEKNGFIDLVKKRAYKQFGIIYKVSPGITHDEVSRHPVNGSICTGVVAYNPFTLVQSKKFTYEMFHNDVDVDTTHVQGENGTREDNQCCCFSINPTF